MIFQRVKGITLDGKKDACKKNPLQEYLNPKKVYIPLLQRTCVLEPEVKIGDQVKAGQLIAINQQYFNVRVHASISGKVTAIKKVWHSSGKMVDAIEIENDNLNTLVEDIKEEKSLDELTRQDFIDKLEKSGLTGLGGAGFPTYVKYRTKSKIDTVIINAVECEPYLTCDFHYLLKFKEKLVRGARYLRRAA